MLVAFYCQADWCQDEPFIMNRDYGQNKVTNFLLLYVATTCNCPVLGFSVSAPSRKCLIGNQRLVLEFTGSVPSLPFLEYFTLCLVSATR